MMKLGKLHQDEHQACAAALETALSMLSEAEKEFAAARRAAAEAVAAANEAHEKLTTAAEAANKVISDAADFRQGRVEEMQAYFDERSEKWQESDAGEAYLAWVSAWEDVDLDEADVPAIDEAEPEVADREDLVTAFEELPSSPDEA